MHLFILYTLCFSGEYLYCILYLVTVCNGIIFYRLFLVLVTKCCSISKVVELVGTEFQTKWHFVPQMCPPNPFKEYLAVIYQKIYTLITLLYMQCTALAMFGVLLLHLN